MISSRRSYDITDFDHMSHDKEHESSIDTLPEADQQGVLLDVDHDDEYSVTKYSVHIPEKKSSAIFIIQAEDDYISDRQCICCSKRCMCFLVLLFFIMASGFAAWLAYNYLVQSPGMVTNLTAKSGNEWSNMSVEEQTTYISTAAANSKNGFQTSTRIPETTVKVCTTESCVRTANSLLSRMNKSVDPCQDFYQYSCGGYLDRTRLSWRKSRYRENPDEMLEREAAYQIEVLSGRPESRDPQYIRMLKTAFKSCLYRPETMDVRSRFHLKSLLTELGFEDFLQDSSNTTISELTNILVKVILRYKASPFFKVIVQNNKIHITNQYPDLFVEQLIAQDDNVANFRFLTMREFYFRDEARDPVILAYKNLLKLVWVDLYQYDTTNEDTDHEIDQKIDELYSFEKLLNMAIFESTNHEFLAPAFIESSRRRLDADYSEYPILWTEFWNAFESNVTGEINNITVYAALSTTFGKILNETDLNLLKRYVISHTIINTDIFYFLPKDIMSAATTIEKLRHNDQQLDTPEGAQCLSYISKYIPEALATLYFTTGSLLKETTISNIFNNITEAFEKIFKHQWWISVADKKTIYKNMQNLSLVYDWRKQNLSELNSLFVFSMQEERFLVNFEHLLQYRVKRYFSQMFQNISEPNVGIVASNYNPIQGVLEVTASSLQEPLFRGIDSPAFIQYGAYGAFIAREIAQTFDIHTALQLHASGDIGHVFLIHLALRLDCLVDHYNDYVLLQEIGKHANLTYKLRGDLTKNENFRDIVGLMAAHTAYKALSSSARFHEELPGISLTPEQAFFVAYGQNYCEKINTDGLMQYYILDLENDVSPGEYRLKGSVSNFILFADAFSCPVGSPMNPPDKCVIF